VVLTQAVSKRCKQSSARNERIELEAMATFSCVQNRIIKTFPEVDSVWGKAGRTDRDRSRADRDVPARRAPMPSRSSGYFLEIVPSSEMLFRCRTPAPSPWTKRRR
jgi:hypothetical protein